MYDWYRRSCRHWCCFLIPYKNSNEGKGCLFNVFDIRVFWKYYSHAIFGGRIFTQSFSKRVILPFPNMAETVSQHLKLWARSKNSSRFLDILLIISLISCTFPDYLRYAFILILQKYHNIGIITNDIGSVPIIDIIPRNFCYQGLLPSSRSTNNISMTSHTVKRGV